MRITLDIDDLLKPHLIDIIQNLPVFVKFGPTFPTQEIIEDHHTKLADINITAERLQPKSKSEKRPSNI